MHTEIVSHTDRLTHKIPMGAMRSNQVYNLKISTRGIFTFPSICCFSYHCSFLVHFPCLPPLLQEQTLPLAKVNITRWKWTFSVCVFVLCEWEAIICCLAACVFILFIHSFFLYLSETQTSLCSDFLLRANTSQSHAHMHTDTHTLMDQRVPMCPLGKKPIVPSCYCCCMKNV